MCSEKWVEAVNIRTYVLLNLNAETYSRPEIAHGAPVMTRECTVCQSTTSAHIRCRARFPSDKVEAANPSGDLRRHPWVIQIQHTQTKINRRMRCEDLYSYQTTRTADRQRLKIIVRAVAVSMCMCIDGCCGGEDERRIT